MRTYVRVEPGHDPPRRPRRVLRLGRAARQPGAARQAGDRRHGRGAGVQLRGQGAAASKTAMGGHRALRLCPDAIVVSPRMQAYTEASRAVFEVFDDTSPQVEPLSIDEAFLDARGMERIAGTPEQIARRLRREVRERVGLPITVGVARTKFLAKVASAQAKPDGLLVVPPEGELAFLHPLPIEALWGVGPATAERMRRVGIETVGAGRRDRRERADHAVRQGRRAQAARARPQPRPAPGDGRAAAARDGHAARVRAPPALGGGARHDARRAGRPADAAAAAGRARRAHDHAADAPPRLGPLDALAHAAGGDREHDDAAVRVPRAARRRAPADRAARADAAGDHALEPRRRARGPARAAARVPPGERARRRARRRPRPLRRRRDQARGAARARHWDSRSRCFQIEDRS